MNNGGSERMTADALPLDALVEPPTADGDTDVPYSSVASLATFTAETAEAFCSAVMRDLRDVSDYVQALRYEIDLLQVHELGQTRIPAAGQELHAVNRAAEAAAHTIMGHAEAVLAADCADPAAYKALVDRTMLAVFEACAFQDIAGQRIAKVVETLQHIEERVSRFAAAVCAAGVSEVASKAQHAHSDRKRRLLLHGPPLPGEGSAQSEIDEIFAAPSS
jgi:chemotaxis protein CheZ